MKKILISLIAAVASVGIVAYGAPSTVASYSAPNLVSEINKAFANTTNTTLSVDGKSTLNGELEVNKSDVDINMTLSANEIDIAQTNTTGQASTPLININDDRTGATADEASEATIYIDADGAYGLTVADGIVQIEGEIDTASGDITLDPAGSEVHIDGGVHIGGTDAVGDNNLKVDGTLTQIGVATFNAAVTAASVRVNGQLSLANGEYFVNDQDTYIKASGHLVSLGDGTFNLGSSTQQFGYLYLQSDIAAEDATFRDGLTVGTNVTISSLTAGSPVFASGAKVLTTSGLISNANIATGAITADKIDSSIVTNVLAAGMTLPAVSGEAVTNLAGANIVSLSAAKLVAASVASAIDGSAVTNLTADNITAGGTFGAIDGSAVTNLTAANVGTVAEGAAITNSILVADGAGGFSTNTMIFYPFGGGYIVKSSTPIP